MPATMTMPMLKRLAAPAPLASRRGTSPTTIAAVVTVGIYWIVVSWAFSQAAPVAEIDNLLSQLMAYRANAPVIDRLLEEAGFGKGHPIGALLTGLEPPRTGAAVPPVSAQPGHGAS